MRVYRFEVNMTPVREFQDKTFDRTASEGQKSQSRSTGCFTARVLARRGDWGVF